jgi:divalent metal cation (Fe/Co/Zn/Cd) transporter
MGAYVTLGGAVAKGAVGVWSGSAALVADAAHSLSDLGSDAVTIDAVDQQHGFNSRFRGGL